MARNRSRALETSEAAVSDKPGVRTASRTREAHTSDFNAIAALKIRTGLSRDCRENWNRLWYANPALPHLTQPLPKGWVQEVDGNIVGYMGAIPMLYQYGEQTLVASAATCFAVDPGYRAASLGLVGSFFRQRGCDLLVNSTAIPAVGKIMQAFKAGQVPQRDYHTVLFWVLDAQAFAKAALAKLDLNPTFAAAASWAASPLLKTDILVRRRWPRRSAQRLSCRRLRVEEIGDDFQDLWTRKVAEAPRLLAWRTPEMLRWHFLAPEKRRKTDVLACYSGRRLDGYAVVQTGLTGPFGLRKAIIADLIAIGDRPQIVADLLANAYEVARQEKSAVLELLGFPEAIREVCKAGKPLSRTYPACPFYYKAEQPALRETLARGESWYACPFDGDTTIGFN